MALDVGVRERAAALWTESAAVITKPLRMRSVPRVSRHVSMRYANVDQQAVPVGKGKVTCRARDLKVLGQRSLGISGRHFACVGAHYRSE